jgi:hypothetical protein
VWDWTKQGLLVLIISVLVARYGWAMDEAVLLLAVFAVLYRGSDRSMDGFFTVLNGIAFLEALTGAAYGDGRLSAGPPGPRWVLWFRERTAGPFAKEIRRAPARPSTPILNSRLMGSRHLYDAQPGLRMIMPSVSERQFPMARRLWYPSDACHAGANWTYLAAGWDVARSVVAVGCCMHLFGSVRTGGYTQSTRARGSYSVSSDCWPTDQISVVKSALLALLVVMRY